MTTHLHVDPDNITHYDLSEAQLQAQLVWWLCAAGHNGRTTAKALDRFWAHLYRPFDPENPPLAFTVLDAYDTNELARELKRAGIGGYAVKSRGLTQLGCSGIDLKTCTADELETFAGIGPKTARCFLLHTRPDARYAGLDTHVLHFLRDLGYDTPRSTPSNPKTYAKWEKVFLNLVDLTDRTPAQIDLLIWRVYSKHPHLKGRAVKWFDRQLTKSLPPLSDLFPWLNQQYEVKR